MTKEEAIACRDLCHTLLKQPAEQAIRLGDPARFERVPPHKRLGHAGAEWGLPIGNLTSQFFANVYLNELDQFVKHTLKCRHYLRYVDDFILLHPDPERLRQWEREIETFLRERLQLELKAERKLRPVSNGADFLGYIVRPDYILVRRRVVGNLREKLQRFEGELFGWERFSTATGGAGRRRRGGLDHGSGHSGRCGPERCHLSKRWHLFAGRNNDQDHRGCKPLPPGRRFGGRPLLRLRRAQREALRATLASYLGHFRHADHYRLVTALFAEFPWLNSLFCLDATASKLTPRWEPNPSEICGYRSQVAWFRSQFPQAELWVQRGREMDRFPPRAPVSTPAPCADQVPPEKPPAGFEPAGGFLERDTISRRDGIASGPPVLAPEGDTCGQGRPPVHVETLVIREAGYLKGGLKRRLITRIQFAEGALS